MRQIKWERPQPSKFSEESLGFWKIYQAECKTEEPANSELYNAVFDFAHALAITDRIPSLVAMDVPFGIRKLHYEQDSTAYGLGILITKALNARDANFIHWVAFSNPEPIVQDRALLAKCIWRWYYKVFEPTAIRFRTSGSEYYKP